MDSPILFEVPEQLETSRILLRRPRNGDGPLVYEAVLESLTELRRWGASLPWAMHEPSVASSEKFCREAQASFIQRSRLTYLLLRKSDGRLIGSSGLQSIDWRVPKFEVGYWCRTSEQGQGFVTEAVSALATLAFKSWGARRVWCSTDELNDSSRRVCEKMGMSLEATLRHERMGVQGELRNTCIYALVE